jgi:hypothetical protein
MAYGERSGKAENVDIEAETYKERSARCANEHRASRKLSARSCAIGLPRAPPIACRMAISCSRTLARASSKLAKLVQAISSTNAVVAS